MWDEDDTFAHWLNLICGIIAGALAVLFGYLEYLRFNRAYGYGVGRHWVGGAALTMTYFTIRCLWYAATGKNNINRDYF